HRRPLRRPRPPPRRDGRPDRVVDAPPAARPGSAAPVSPFEFAWRSLSRQPARAVLGLTGVAVVGALLFDMLMLSRGLIVSFRDLLESTGFDVRVTATEALPGMGPPVADAASTTEELRRLPELAAVVPARFGVASIDTRNGKTAPVAFIGSETRRRGEWKLVEGADLGDDADGGRPEVVVNRTFAREEVLERLRHAEFSYFRQVSFVLATIASFFALLLVTTLLTVSVNQRLGEVAALRALGFSRRRITFDLLAESALLVGGGGLVAIPLGLLLARGLDSILRRMPDLPTRLHFFVFEPRALALHAGFLVLAALVAAAYPVALAARLPIAATLRKENVS